MPIQLFQPLNRIDSFIAKCIRDFESRIFDFFSYHVHCHWQAAEKCSSHTSSLRFLIVQLKSRWIIWSLLLILNKNIGWIQMTGYLVHIVFFRFYYVRYPSVVSINTVFILSDDIGSKFINYSETPKAMHVVSLNQFGLDFGCLQGTALSVCDMIGMDSANRQKKLVVA